MQVLEVYGLVGALAALRPTPPANTLIATTNPTHLNAFQHVPSKLPACMYDTAFLELVVRSSGSVR